jgi:hypothetical protein
LTPVIRLIESERLCGAQPAAYVKKKLANKIIFGGVQYFFKFNSEYIFELS